MIIPSQHASRVARAAAGGGGGDVTPNAVNWATVSYNNDYEEWAYSERQITGIDQTITLQVQIANGSGATLYYFVSSSAGAKVSGDATSATSPSGFSMNSIANDGTFTVTNNQYVTFGAEISALFKVL